MFSLYGALCNPFVLTFLAAALDTGLTFPGISPGTLLYRSAQVRFLFFRPLPFSNEVISRLGRTE